MLLLSTVELQAQWKQVNIGSAGKVNSIAPLGADLFTGTNAGIYRSSDNGASWTNVKGSFTLCLAGSDSIMFAGTSSGVIVSTDGGNSWAPPASGMSYYVTALAVKDSLVFAETYQNGIFRSTDDGASWTAVNNGLGPFQNLITSLAVNGKAVLAGTASGVCISTDDGSNWSTLAAINLSSPPADVANESRPGYIHLLTAQAKGLQAHDFQARPRRIRAVVRGICIARP